MSKSEPESFNLDPNSPWGRSVTEAEFSEMCNTGRIEGELLERYWRMNDFHGPAPAYIEVMVSKRDVDRLIRQIEREGRVPKKRPRG